MDRSSTKILRYDPNKNDKIQCLEAVAQPEKWPRRPFLPLKRKGASCANDHDQIGYILENVPRTVFLGNIFNVSNTTPPASVKYNSWDELFDVWTID